MTTNVDMEDAASSDTLIE